MWYGTDLLTCKMTVLEMVRSNNDKETFEEIPRFTMDSDRSKHYFHFQTDVVLKSIKHVRSKWLVIDFCQNKTVQHINVYGNTGTSGKSGPGILAFVGTTKSKEKRENDNPGWNETPMECKNLNIKQGNSGKFSIECSGPSEGQFLSLQMAMTPKSHVLLEIIEIEVTL